MKLSFFHNINTKLCYAGCICLIAASASCGTGTASKSSDNSIQIGMDSIMVCDSITDQSGIKVTASFSATFPASFKNSKKEAGKLLSTINSAIFNTTDANMPDVAKKTVSDRLASYSSTAADSIDESFEDETTPVSNFGIRLAVSPIYHNFDFLCLVKNSTTSKDFKPSLASKSFYTFDLQSGKRVMLSDIFSETDILKINDLLQKQLLTDTKCGNSDQLADYGYFNADNLSATENFSLTDNGISFHYNPLEIACYAVGEVCIFLPYKDLKQYINPQSPINRIVR